MCGLNILIGMLFQLPDAPTAGNVANLFAATATVNLIEAVWNLGSMEITTPRKALTNGLLALAPLATSLLTNAVLN